MNRWFFLGVYSLVYISGIFPVTYKNLEKIEKKRNKLSTWTPWKLSRFSFFFGFGQILAIILDVIRQISGHENHKYEVFSSQRFILKLGYYLMVAGKLSLTIFCVLTTIIRAPEIKLILNNVCSLYFGTLGHTVHPEARKFFYLIIYVGLSVVLYLTDGISLLIFQTHHPEDVVWQLPHKLTLTYVEIVLAVILIYFQSAIEGLNGEIKAYFPGVNEWNLNCWKPAELSEVKITADQRSPKSSIAMKEYRLAYRTVAEIIDQINSAYGFLLLLIVIHNQMKCLILAFGYNSALFVTPKNDLEGRVYSFVIKPALSCFWCFVRLSIILHGFEIVLKESIRQNEIGVRVTKNYIASIDISVIDTESKVELLEFLEEIDGRKVRFMASNIFSLDYPTLYLILTATLTYIIICVQYLSP